MLALNAADIRRLVPMPRAIELMKRVFAAYTEGKTITPIRVSVPMPDGSGTVLFMPAFVPSSDTTPAATGAKIVSVFPGNRERGIATINAVVVSVDPRTGVPVGLLEGATVTALRTGAVSGAATDLLARPDAAVLAVIGAGVQGVTQAAAVAAVRDIREVRVADVSPQATATFAERLRIWDAALAKRVRVVPNAEQAVRGADVICTATTATSAVFEDAWLSPGAHINGIGAFTPAMQEVPVATVQRARIVVDAVETVMHEAGDLVKAIEQGAIRESDITTELGHLVLGRAQGRTDAEQITFFKSVGNAIQDMIVAGVAIEEAQRAGVGQQIALD